jgi:glycosyltransferase involved in cell wall biosynthesis
MLRVISPDNGWILERCTKELEGIKTKKNISYFINYACYDDSLRSDINVALFTHREETGANRKKFEEVALKVDHCVSMCKNTTKILKELGAKNITEIYMGSDDRLDKEIIFGVVGRVYGSGRKGESLIKQLNDDGYNVVAHGKGWDCPIFSDRYEDIPNFYKEIDYLIVPSVNEGGPIPVLDAIRAGIPIIAPDVGFSWEFPVIKYKKGDYKSLKRVVEKLNNSPTWEKWREKHQNLLERL